MVEGDLDPHGFDATYLRHEISTRQPIGGNAEMQHAAGQRTGFADFHAVATAGEMVGRRQSAWAAADHQDALAAWRRRYGRLPGLCGCQVTQKPLHGMNADGTVELAAAAVRLAWMIADPPVDGREGIVAQDRFPGLVVFPGLCEIKPHLHVFAGRARLVARRQEVNIDRSSHAGRAGPLLAQQVDDRGEIRLSGGHLLSRTLELSD